MDSPAPQPWNCLAKLDGLRRVSAPNHSHDTNLLLNAVLALFEIARCWQFQIAIQILTNYDAADRSP